MRTILVKLSADSSMRQHSYHPSQLLSKMQAGPMCGIWKPTMFFGYTVPLQYRSTRLARSRVAIKSRALFTGLAGLQLQLACREPRGVPRHPDRSTKASAQRMQGTQRARNSAGRVLLLNMGGAKLIRNQRSDSRVFEKRSDRETSVGSGRCEATGLRLQDAGQISFAVASDNIARPVFWQLTDLRPPDQNVQPKAPMQSCETVQPPEATAVGVNRQMVPLPHFHKAAAAGFVRKVQLQIKDRRAASGSAPGVCGSLV